jgi:hypothetical protein
VQWTQGALYWSPLFLVTSLNVRNWLHPIAAALICFVAYWFTLPAGITLEDAGLFQMVCHLGGISHPPGYPLFTELCQPFVGLGFFDQGVLAGNLLSALFAALAVAVVHQIALAYQGRWFAWIVSIAYGLSATFWSQAIIIEVYSLAVLMFVLCWWCAIQFVRSGRLATFYLLGLTFGLALCNHWPLMLLSTPALLVLLWQRMDTLLAALRRPEFWLFSTGSLVLGLTPYLTLFAADPVIAVYGGIDTVRDFLGYVGRKTYADADVAAGMADKLSFAGWLLIESARQLGSWTLPIVLFGAWLWGRTRPLVGLALLLMYLGGTFVLLAQINFDYQFFSRAIFKPYPIIAYLAVTFCFGLGLIRLSQWAGDRSGKWLTPASRVIVLLLVAVGNFPGNDRSVDTFVDHYARAVLRDLPADSILFVHGDFETSVFGYLVLVEGARSDIELREWEALVFDNRLTSPFASDEHKQSTLARLIESSSRPVATIDTRLTPVTDRGGFYLLRSENDPLVLISQDMDQFVQYLLLLNSEDLLTDPHERYHAFNLLIRFSRAYFELATASPTPEAWVMERTMALQQTFQGKLVTLETMIRKGRVHPGNRAMLLALAAEAARQIPEVATNKSRAILHEYYGRLLRLEDADAGEAFSHFEQSLALYPASENTSICGHRALADRFGFESAYLQQFRNVPCPH